MSEPSEVWELSTRQLGRRVLRYEVLDSTNAYCLQLARDESQHGLAVLADRQTAGRGQHGRSWLCEPGMGVLLSLLLFPPPALRRPAILTAWAAVAVCEALRSVANLQAKIKWPNDVLVQGRKVCGILIEQNKGVVVGIGLNVNQPAAALAEAGLPDAGSVGALAGRTFDVPGVARLLLQQLDQDYERLTQDDLHTLEACWKWRLGLLGRQVRLETHTGWHSGRLLDVTFDGVLLETAADEMLLQPESIKHIVEERA